MFVLERGHTSTITAVSPERGVLLNSAQHAASVIWTKKEPCWGSWTKKEPCWGSTGPLCSFRQVSWGSAGPSHFSSKDLDHSGPWTLASDLHTLFADLICPGALFSSSNKKGFFNEMHYKFYLVFMFSANKVGDFLLLDEVLLRWGLEDVKL